MNKLTSRLSIILAVLFMFMACKKEMSVENGLSGGNAQGELVDSLGNCKRADVQGTYKVDTPLTTSTNFAIINVNFTSQGKYKIYSDTVNGMWFIDSGFTVTTGPVNVKLKGYGTPILPKVTDFALFFNNTLCTFSVTVGGTAGSGTTGTKGDFFPTTSGSNFIYKFIPPLGALDTFSVDVLPGLIPYNGLNYAQFATSARDTFYFAKDGAGTYYALSSVDFDYVYLFESLPNFFISYPFLKENEPVGTSWTTAEYGPVVNNGQKGTAKAIFTIIAKNFPYTVGTNTYPNVINVKREVMFKPDGGSYALLLEGNAYYAKDYGLVDQVFKTTIPQKLSIFQIPTIK